MKFKAENSLQPGQIWDEMGTHHLLEPIFQDYQFLGGGTGGTEFPISVTLTFPGGYSRTITRIE